MEGERGQGEGTSSSMAGVGRLANMTVSVQRRLANVLQDASRQQSIEMFLGLRVAQNFPSARLPDGSQHLRGPDSESDDDSDAGGFGGLAFDPVSPPPLPNHQLWQ